jgi:hypothetical protein
MGSGNVNLVRNEEWEGKYFSFILSLHHPNNGRKILDWHLHYPSYAYVNAVFYLWIVFPFVKVNLGSPYVRVFRTCPVFSGFRIVSGGNLNFHKHPDFWPLLIVALNFSVVVTYVTVRSYSTPRFNFRTYISPTSVGTEHIPVPVVRFELCPEQWRSRCALFRSCVFLLRSYNGLKKM